MNNLLGSNSHLQFKKKIHNIIKVNSKHEKLNMVIAELVKQIF